VSQPDAHALEIQFDYSYDDAGFFGSAERAALESAASYIEGIIGDDFDAIVPDVGAGNTWQAIFFDPEDYSSTSETNLTIAADTLRVYVGSGNLGGALGLAQPGGFTASGTTAWTTAVTTRGEGGVITPYVVSTPSTQTDDTEVAPWGGVISFDNTVTWNFDDESGAGATGLEYDFRTVAIHELGHVLGHGIVESYSNLVNGSNEFTGPTAVALHGGNIALTGDLHFAAATSGTVYGGAASQTALMTASLPNGTRREFTGIDVAALDDIGYDVVPEPSSALLLLTACAAFLFRRPQRTV